MKKAPTLLADHKLQEEGTALNSPKRKGLLQKLASPILAACLATCGIATGNDQIEETLQKKQKKAEMAAIGGRQNPLANILKDILTFVSGESPAKALKEGIPKDPTFTPKEALFPNGIPKNPPLTPSTPTYKNRDATLADKLKLTLFASRGGAIVGEINTPDGKMAPEEILNQYLEEVKGGKEALIRETQENYTRDKNKLPWDMNPENRSRRVPIKIKENHIGTFLDIPKEILIGDHLAKSGETKTALHPALATNTPKSQTQKNTLLANGYTPEGAEATFGDVLGHELMHAATIGSHLKPTLDKLKGNITPKRPYLYGLSEEYKVGTLTFLNKSRQLTGKKLTNPQEIHQLFDEIEARPEILEKNYSPEEARLPKTYLFLKETNPEAAEMLRNATARDCQYLAKQNQKQVEQCQNIANTPSHPHIKQEVLLASTQISNPKLQKNRSIAQLHTNQNSPLSQWLPNTKTPKSPNQERQAPSLT